MSKMGQHVMEMQEDALEMDRDAFVAKHGKANADLYDKINIDYECNIAEEQLAIQQMEEAGIVPVIKDKDGIPF